MRASFRTFPDGQWRATGAGRPQIAGHALVRYRHAVQLGLPTLLYRVLAKKNDRLVYLTAAEVTESLDEIEAGGLTTSLIGFTGGEPFMNPELPGMFEDVLSAVSGRSF
jgi:hypothetical protein